MSFVVRNRSVRASIVLAAWASLACLACLGVACSSGGGSSPTSGSGAGGAGGAGGNGGNGAGGASATCPQADSLLDVSKAPGAGQAYPAPTLSGMCTGEAFIVDSNAIPHYTFVAITPNPLQSRDLHYEIPLKPEVAPQTTEIPLLGTVGFAVNGMPFFGPNEGPIPMDSAYGDPIYNGIMDPCLGHTANTYHYHSMEEKCLIADGLVSEPWTNPDPNVDTASPILGWALDGFPIYGSRECLDSACNDVVVMRSGYAQIADPKSNAWDAYQWSEHAGDTSYLDACNGHYGPSGDYHYHVTQGFPYILGCYRGTPGVSGGGAGAGGGGGAGGGMNMPKSCTGPADCAVGDCPPGSIGCTCGQTPMGMICIPTCNTNADCPTGPMGMQLQCNNGVCAP